MSTSAHERKRENKIVTPKKNPYTITAQGSQNSTGNPEPNNITLTTNLDKLQS